VARIMNHSCSLKLFCLKVLFIMLIVWFSTHHVICGQGHSKNAWIDLHSPLKDRYRDWFERKYKEDNTHLI
jgi:hypothetical protein